MAADARAGARRCAVPHPLLGRRRRSARGRQEVLAPGSGPDTTWLLDEHRIDGSTSVLPGTAYVEIVRAAVGLEAPGQALAIDELLLLVPLAVEPGAECDLRVDRRHRGAVGVVAAVDRQPVQSRCRMDRERARAGAPSRCQRPGPDRRSRPHGGLQHQRRDCRPVVAQRAGTPPGAGIAVALPAAHPHRSRRRDDRDRAIARIVRRYRGDGRAPGPARPGRRRRPSAHRWLRPERRFLRADGLRGVRIWQPLPPALRVRARRLPAEDGTAAFELTVADESGVVVLEIERLTLRRIDATTALVPRSLPGRGASEPVGQPSVLQTLLAGGIDTASGLAALDRILAHAGPLPSRGFAAAARRDRQLTSPTWRTALRSGRGGAPSRRLVEPRTDAETESRGAVVEGAGRRCRRRRRQLVRAGWPLAAGDSRPVAVATDMRRGAAAPFLLRVADRRRAGALDAADPHRRRGPAKPIAWSRSAGNSSGEHARGARRDGRQDPDAPRRRHTAPRSPATSSFFRPRRRSSACGSSTGCAGGIRSTTFPPRSTSSGAWTSSCSKTASPI